MMLGCMLHICMFSTSRSAMRMAGEPRSRNLIATCSHSPALINFVVAKGAELMQQVGMVVQTLCMQQCIHQQEQHAYHGCLPLALQSL